MDQIRKEKDSTHQVSSRSDWMGIEVKRRDTTRKGFAIKFAVDPTRSEVIGRDVRRKGFTIKFPSDWNEYDWNRTDSN